MTAFFLVGAVFTTGIIVGVVVEFLVVKRIIRDKRFHVTWRKHQ